jgi:hypothetical protein
MAVYSLLFGHAEWPTETPRRDTVARELDAAAREHGRPRRLSVSVPATLRERVEASAALEGVPEETWVVRALSRSVDPRLLEVSR